MDAIIGGRQTGKTYKLVEWYREQPGERVIIVSSKETADWLHQEFNVPSGDILNLFDAGVRLRGRHREIGVDNIEHILMEYFGQIPSVVTFTGNVII